jgi:hypothetical protein
VNCDRASSAHALSLSRWPDVLLQDLLLGHDLLGWDVLEPAGCEDSRDRSHRYERCVSLCDNGRSTARCHSSAAETVGLHELLSIVACVVPQTSDR